MTYIKGRHSKKFKIPWLYWKPTRLYVYVTFNETAKYKIEENRNILDWNKLIGFSRGNHMDNSIRLAWRWNPYLNAVETAEYRHIDGKIEYKNLGTVELNKEYAYLLIMHKGNYSNWGYKLFPFFGGNETAPQNINVKYRFKIK